MVDVGALVTRGQQIARSGDVGFCPTAHLHVARVPSKGHEGSDMYWCRCLTEIWANYSCDVKRKLLQKLHTCNQIAFDLFFLTSETL